LIEQVYSGQFQPEELVDRKSPVGVYITPEMVEHTNEFLSDRRGVVEHDTSFAGHGYEIKGRADRVIFDNGILEVHDFKYGWRLVEVEENWTLIAHAIGYALQLVHGAGVDLFKDIRAVVFKIYQPRPFHPNGKVREWSISSYELNEYHKQLNDIMNKPSDYVSTGANCKNCPSLGVCSAHNKATMNSIDVSELPFHSEITDADLSVMLTELKRAKKTIETALKAYEDIAMHRISQGQIVAGYGLERGLSNRHWNKNVTPEFIKLLTGREDLTKVELITPTQAVKKGVPEDVVNSLSARTETGLKLCEVDVNKKVEKVFGDWIKENGYVLQD
jgi:hypothetical protein